MKTRKTVSLILTLVMVFFSVVPVFSAKEEAVYDLGESFQSEYDNDLNKLHFMCLQQKQQMQMTEL